MVSCSSTNVKPQLLELVQSNESTQLDSSVIWLQ